MKFIYNSWDIKHKEPFGAVKQGTSVSFTAESDAEKVYLTGFGEKIEMQKSENRFTASAIPDIECGLIHYGFEVHYDHKIRHFGQCARGGMCEKNGGLYQLTVHKNGETPSWFKNKIMYQIYVDRFFKGLADEIKLRDGVLIHSSWDEPPVYVKNDKGEIVIWDFFGGNLDGVIQKLEYLKGLGVDIIYLNPIFESISNHKYDTADYSKIDRMYGTQDTLKRLVKEADKLGMKIMLDGVFSHTGDDSIYFNKYKHYGESGAYNDPDSEYAGWYKFENFPQKYDCWWGVTALPCVNELEPSFIDYLLNEKTGAVIKWMKAGVAGWRLDVADELPDEFIKELKNAILKVNPEAVLLGEVWEDASNKISYDNRRMYILNDSMNSVSNYPLRDGLLDLLLGRISPDDFASHIMKLQENYPREIFLSLMNMTGTHDSTRLATLLGEAPEQDSMNTWQKREFKLSQDNFVLARLRAELYFTAIYMMPGNPCIYYGDEILTQGYTDPYNRSTYDWNTKNDDIIKLIAALKKVRDEIVSEDIRIIFEFENDILIYSLVGGEKEYKVLINHTKDLKEIHTDNFEEKFMLRAKKTNRTISIDPYGAAVIVLS